MSKTVSKYISDEVTTHGLRLAEPAIKDMCERRGVDLALAMRFAEHVDRLARVDALATDADHVALSSMARELDKSA